MVSRFPPPTLHLLAENLKSVAIVDDGNHVTGELAKGCPIPEVTCLVLLHTDPKTDLNKSTKKSLVGESKF